MIKFYNDYYCSDNMTVTIISPGKLTNTTKLFKNIFNNIPNKSSKKNNHVKKELYFSNKQKEYQYIPIIDTNDIYYIWEIPLKFNFLKSKIYSIIDYVIEDIINNLEQILIKNLIKKMLVVIL